MIRQIGCKYSQALCITSLICKYMPSGVYRMIKEIPASISPGLSRHPWLSFTGVCPLIFTVASPTSYDSLYFASLPSSFAPSHRAASFQQRASARCRCAGRSWQAACRAVFCRWPWTRRILPRRIADGPYEGRFPARWPRRGQGLRPAPETRCLTAPRTAR